MTADSTISDPDAAGIHLVASASTVGSCYPTYPEHTVKVPISTSFNTASIAPYARWDTGNLPTNAADCGSAKLWVGGYLQPANSPGVCVAISSKQSVGSWNSSTNTCTIPDVEANASPRDSLAGDSPQQTLIVYATAVFTRAAGRQVFWARPDVGIKEF